MAKSVLAISVFLSLAWTGVVALFFGLSIIDVYLLSFRFDKSDFSQWVIFIIQFAPIAVLMIIAAQRIMGWFSSH